MGVYKYDAINDELIPIAGIPSVPGIEDKVSTYTADATYWDTSPSSASNKPVTSGGIFTALADKANATDLANKVSKYSSDATQWDTSPTSASTKPVTSGGVYTALADKADTSDLDGKAPTSHASTETTYGVASTTDYGHVKTSTGITNSSGTISVAYGTTAGTACEGNDSRLSNSRTPTAHASSATTYGAASMSNYGHVKLSDNYTSSAGTADQAIGASSKAVYDAYNNQNSNKANQTVIATRQTNLTASRAYKVGEQFIYNNVLYKATAAISSGGTITIGGNATTSEDIVSQISNLTTPQTVTITSGYAINRNNSYSIGKLVTLNVGLAAPAGYNAGNYLEIASSPKPAKTETAGVAIVLYGTKSFATVAKITSLGKIFIFTTSDIFQTAGNNNCDITVSLCYVSN